MLRLRTAIAAGLLLGIAGLFQRFPGWPGLRPGSNFLDSPTNLTAPNVDQPEVQKWREDLRFLYEEMPKWHKNLFHTISRRQFTEAVEDLNRRLPLLARHQIIVEMARIAAMIGDGHTNIAPTRDPRIGFRTYPLKLYFFKDGLYVRATTREHAANVGSRVTRIGEVSVEQAYDAVRQIIGHDNEMGARFFAPFLLAMPEVLHSLGIISNMEKGMYTVESRGHRKTIMVKPLCPAAMLAPDTDTSWMPSTGWVDAREGAGSPTPLWLKHPQNKFWFEYLSAPKILYVQFNQVGNKEDETVEVFAQRLFAFVETNPVDRFVLDLRLNRGGNGELNRPLLLGIIKCSKIDQKGKLFTIIGRGTWSAAQFLCNDLERFTHTLFVGEPTGGKVNSFGDSQKIVLPNSGVTVRVSTLWWQGDERDTRQWTAPQLAADLTFEDYQRNSDPALDVILHYAPTKSLSECLEDSLASETLTSLTSVYREWKSNPLNEYLDAEPELNTLGYRLMAMKEMRKAIAVFKLCVEVSPRSWKAYDSLGETYLKAGQKELAITNYEKSIELNPGNTNGIRVLEVLRGK